MKEQLLFIEDNNMTGEFLKRMFDGKYEIKWCQSAEEALKWLGEFNVPNLIVTDYALPDMDGLDFLTAVKQMGFIKDIPVVMLSGKASDGIKKKAVEAGAADFIMKPFKPKMLRFNLEKLLYSRKRFAPQLLA